jgi:hypothetical protein
VRRVVSLFVALATNVCVGQEEFLRLQTTGGVTYLTLSATMQGDDHLEIGSPSRSGTNISVRFWRVPGWLLCFDCWHAETNTAVLGTLEPGWYSLWLNLDTFGLPDPFPFLQMAFEVPDDGGRTLTVTIGDTADERVVCVAGVPAAFYGLAASTNLLDWTAVCTNQGSFCWIGRSMAEAPIRFFRARVFPGRIVGPLYSASNQTRQATAASRLASDRSR